MQLISCLTTSIEEKVQWGIHMYLSTVSGSICHLKGDKIRGSRWGICQQFRPAIIG